MEEFLAVRVLLVRFWFSEESSGAQNHYSFLGFFRYLVFNISNFSTLFLVSFSHPAGGIPLQPTIWHASETFSRQVELKVGFVPDKLLFGDSICDLFLLILGFSPGRIVLNQRR